MSPDKSKSALEHIDIGHVIIMPIHWLSSTCECQIVVCCIDVVFEMNILPLVVTYALPRNNFKTRRDGITLLCCLSIKINVVSVQYCRSIQNANNHFALILIGYCIQLYTKIWSTYSLCRISLFSKNYYYALATSHTFVPY